MHRFLKKLTRGVAMLLVAAMVVIPVADALACSFEMDTVHQDASPAGDDEGGDRLHGVCAHNHCHHATAHLSSGAVLVHDLFARGHTLPWQRTALDQGVPDGLMRPPRA